MRSGYKIEWTDNALAELKATYQYLEENRSERELMNLSLEIENTLRLISDKDLKAKHIKNRAKLLSEKIDVTAFMVWFIENYPASVDTMRQNPDYQYNFK